MQPQSNTYKWATWILVIIVIILAIMLTKSNRETITSTLDDAAADVQECRLRLTAWNEAYPEGTTTAQSQTELDAILEDCSDVIGDASDEI